jgi:DNA-nicking Smr family endonuclease
MARLSTDEVELWRRAMHDVAPLRGRRSPAPHRPSPSVSGEKSAPQVRPAQPRPLPAPPPVQAQPLDRFAGVDRATAERVKRGRYPIEGRLDLHGMTQADAHAALARVVGAARAAGKRCLLVITGHGRMSGGILKGAVPRWLNEPGLRQHLLAVSHAQPRDGGSAALYVLLRRLPQRED